jgi:tetratricopeptide (TPR) repeat protein
LPAALEEQVLATGEGNPFFLEELTRSVLEQRQSDRVALDLPETIHAALAARIDRLDADDKHLLQTAAVVGREVPLPLLARVADLDPVALGERLQHLIAREFVFERMGRPERTFAFRHALTQAAAYQSLPRAARGRLHRRAVDAMDALGLDRRPELLETLARHAAEAGDWERALSAYRRAAELATGRHAPREAARCLEAAGVALARMPEDALAVVERCDVRLELAHALYWTGELERAREELDAAKALARRVGDEARLARVLTTLVLVHAVGGRYEEAVGAGVGALAVADVLDDPTVRAWANIALAQPYFALGRYRRAAECSRRAAELTADRQIGHWLGIAPALLPAVTARTWLALSLARLGDLAEAVRWAEDGLRRAEGEDVLSEMWACYGLGRARHACTDFEGAIAALSRAARLCEGGSFPVPGPRVFSGLASALTGMGRADEAFPLLERAFAEARASNVSYGHSLALVQLGEACLAAGRVEEAAEHAAEALAIARARGERGDEAWALHLRGAAAARHGRRRDRHGAGMVRAGPGARRRPRDATARGPLPRIARCARARRRSRRNRPRAP